MKYMRRAGYTWTEYKTNTKIAKELKITPILDMLLEYKTGKGSTSSPPPWQIYDDDDDDDDDNDDDDDDGTQWQLKVNLKNYLPVISNNIITSRRSSYEQLTKRIPSFVQHRCSLPQSSNATFFSKMMNTSFWRYVLSNGWYLLRQTPKRL